MAVAVPLMLRRVPPNPIYGLRVRATFADPSVWYDANAASGRDLFWLGAAIVVAAVVLPRVASGSAPTVLGVGSVVGALMATWRGMRHAERLLAERRGR